MGVDLTSWTGEDKMEEDKIREEKNANSDYNSAKGGAMPALPSETIRGIYCFLTLLS